MARRDDVPYFISINIEIIILYDMHNLLINARRVKNDEFYTKYEDIEKEVKHYSSKYFQNKVILCNCNDAIHGDFKTYFVDNFSKLGLKTLICTSYGPEAYAEYYDGYNFSRKSLILGGDFRSIEMLDILQEADIVVTNPPFSLFRDFISQLVEYNKKFLVIGNVNAITYKDVFPLIKDNKMWLGPSITNVGRNFNVPDNYSLNAAVCGIDADGKKYIRVRNVRWFTNLEHNKRKQPLELHKKYSSEEFPKYDNYDAININKIADIPYDYEGIMGVPITFLDNYCPTQFKIIKFRKGDDDKDLSVNDKCPYFRILIKKSNNEN